MKVLACPKKIVYLFPVVSVDGCLIAFTKGRSRIINIKETKREMNSAVGGQSSKCFK
jgi:hypothetical protein